MTLSKSCRKYSSLEEGVSLYTLFHKIAFIRAGCVAGPLSLTLNGGLRPSPDMEQITVYTFAELSSDVQDKIVSRFADINVDFDWWECVYEDAERVGLKISGFDLYPMNIAIEFTDDAVFTAAKILSEHDGDTRTLALAFDAGRDDLVKKHSDGIRLDIVAEDNEDAFDTECADLEADFLRALGREYLSILEDRYEYLTSREAIVETIEVNDWLFTVEGIRIW